MSCAGIPCPSFPGALAFNGDWLTALPSPVDGGEVHPRSRGAMQPPAFRQSRDARREHHGSISRGLASLTHPSVLDSLESTCRLTLEYLLHPRGPTLLSLEGQRWPVRHRVARSISLIVSSCRSSTRRALDLLYISTAMALGDPQKYAPPLRADDLADGVSAPAGKMQSHRPSSFSTIFLVFTFQLYLATISLSHHFRGRFPAFSPRPPLSQDTLVDFFAESHQIGLLVTFAQDIPHAN